MKTHKVSDVMTTPVVTAGERTPFKDLAELMGQAGVNAVPVVTDKGHVVGVVSVTDLLLKQADPDPEPHPLAGPGRRRELRKSTGTVAAELMTMPAITISPTATVDEAARIMRKHRIGRLPVVDGGTGRLVGVIARRDCIGVYTRPDEELRHDIVHGLIDQELIMDPNRFAVTVEDGRVTIEGKTERRSQIPTLVGSLRRVEGVVSVTARLEFDADDALSEGYAGPLF